MVGQAPAVAMAYDRWAGWYARLVRTAPGVARLRRVAVDELRLGPGETVIDIGCGPGVNLPLLRQAVGPGGRVIGLDIATGMLERVRRTEVTADVIRGDAAELPLAGPVDGILATFVITLFEEPAAIIDRWWSLLAPGGALAVVNLAPMRAPLGRVANSLLEAGLVLTTPGRSAHERALVDVLHDRVNAAHRAIDAHADRLYHVDAADGLVRITVGVNQP